MAEVFQVTKAITGITFNPAGQGSLSVVPVNAQLLLIAQSGVPRFIDVACDGKPYRIFLEDLMARSVALQTMAASS
jgi:hypothetical protein